VGDVHGEDGAFSFGDAPFPVEGNGLGEVGVDFVADFAGEGEERGSWEGRGVVMIGIAGIVYAQIELKVRAYAGDTGY
jgi:hypothetical protein